MLGKKSRIFRAFLGVFIIALGVHFGSWWGALGIIPLFVALTGVCPVCRFLQRCRIPHR